MPRQDSAAPEQSKSPDRQGGALYIVATPIGHLDDMTFRAVNTLQSVERVYCEDTRQSRKLMRHYHINTPLSTYHEHNAANVRPAILSALQQGAQLALISDAGTPLISDPGYKLVEAVREAGIPLIPIPGACAAITALSVSALPTDQFHFAGFLPAKTHARCAQLQALSAIRQTLIFYESPNRVLASLADIEKVWGDRQIVIARELTKRHEEILYGPLSQLRTQLAQRSQIKGEIVLLVAPASQDATDQPDEAVLSRLLAEALETASTKQAAARVAEQTGMSKTALYQLALKLKASE